MTTDKFNQLINQSIDSVDRDLDMKEKIMANLEGKSHKRSKKTLRRTLLIAALFTLLSTTVFAGVLLVTGVIFTDLDLKGDNDEVVASLRVYNEYEMGKEFKDERDPAFDAFHDDLNKSRPHLRDYGIIDTRGDYPRLRLYSQRGKTFSSYHALESYLSHYLLPDRFGDYIFESAHESRENLRYSKEEIQEFADQNPGQDFVVVDLKLGGPERISYHYLHTETGDRLYVFLNFGLNNDKLSYVSKEPGDYEVIKINDLDVVLGHQVNGGSTKQGGEWIEIINKNNYFTTSYIPEKDLKVNVRFHVDYSKKKQVIDGEEVYVATYPENMRDIIITYTEMVHNFIIHSMDTLE